MMSEQMTEMITGPPDDQGDAVVGGRASRFVRRHEGTRRTVYRNWLLVTQWTAFVLFCFTISVAQATNPGKGGVALAVFSAAQSMLMAWLVYRGIRLSIVLSADGVAVHNLFRAYSIPWRDVTRFEPVAAAGVGRRGWTPAVIQRNGRPVKSNAGFLFQRERTVAMVEQLSADMARLSYPGLAQRADEPQGSY